MSFLPSCETSCPIFIETRANIERYMQQKDKAARFQETHLDTAAAETQHFAAAHPDISPDEAEFIGMAMRSRAAYNLGRLNTLIARGQALLQRVGSACVKGPVTYRAPIGDIMFTTTACGSPDVPERGPHEQPEPVYLTRSPINGTA